MDRMGDYRQRLYWLGLILVLLGLGAGMAAPLYRNPRLGLSAHLEGVMNGVFLVLMGLIWDRVSLGRPGKNAVFALLIWGGFANWLACLLGAIFGASRMTPIAGGNFTAKPWQETLVAGMFVSVGVTMLSAVLLLTWGLRPWAKRE